MSATIIPFPGARIRPPWVTPKANAAALVLAHQIKCKLAIKDDPKQLAVELLETMRQVMMENHFKS